MRRKKKKETNHDFRDILFEDGKLLTGGRNGSAVDEIDGLNKSEYVAGAQPHSKGCSMDIKSLHTHPLFVM